MVIFACLIRWRSRRDASNLGIALVSQMRRFSRFDAYYADINPRFSAVFSKNGRIRNAGVTGSSPVSGATLL
jgi:hypothetical protein